MHTTSKRALVYTRDAYRPQGASFNEQLRACHAYARRHGFQVVGHYDDRGSGLVVGSGLRLLDEAVQNGTCDAVIVRDRARLSRNAAVLASMEQSAATLGVTIIAIDEQDGGGDGEP